MTHPSFLPPCKPSFPLPRFTSDVPVFIWTLVLTDSVPFPHPRGLPEERNLPRQPPSSNPRLRYGGTKRGRPEREPRPRGLRVAGSKGPGPPPLPRPYATSVSPFPAGAGARTSGPTITGPGGTGGAPQVTPPTRRRGERTPPLTGSTTPVGAGPGRAAPGPTLRRGRAPGPVPAAKVGGEGLVRRPRPPGPSPRTPLSSPRRPSPGASCPTGPGSPSPPSP